MSVLRTYEIRKKKTGHARCAKREESKMRIAKIWLYNSKGVKESFSKKKKDGAP